LERRKNKNISDPVLSKYNPNNKKNYPIFIKQFFCIKYNKLAIVKKNGETYVKQKNYYLIQ